MGKLRNSTHNNYRIWWISFVTDWLACESISLILQPATTHTITHNNLIGNASQSYQSRIDGERCFAQNEKRFSSDIFTHHTTPHTTNTSFVRSTIFISFSCLSYVCTCSRAHIECYASESYHHYRVYNTHPHAIEIFILECVTRYKRLSSMTSSFAIASQPSMLVITKAKGNDREKKVERKAIDRWFIAIRHVSYEYSLRVSVYVIRIVCGPFNVYRLPAPHIPIHTLTRTHSQLTKFYRRSETIWHEWNE